MSEKQRTVARDVEMEGIGLHTGHKVRMTVKTSEADRGIDFVRTDLSHRPVIRAQTSNVLLDKSLPRCTSIGVRDAEIHTVEHLMAAFYGLGIDNAVVEINGDEVPGLDGSSLDFLSAFKKAGVRELDRDKRYFAVKEPIWAEKNGASISVQPADDFKISYILDYDHPFLKTQFFSLEPSAELFEKEIAPSRTFCLDKEAEELRKNGLGLGANYQNTLVITPDGVKDNVLRYENEFARHKILDFIGDLYLFGQPILGHVVAVKSGHRLNRMLLTRIAEQQEKYSAREAVKTQVSLSDPKLDIDGIMRVLPHRFPFLFVDRIIELEKGKRVVGIKNVTINDYFFKGHFPTRPVMPGVIMVEAMAQAGGIAVLTDEKNDGKLAFFMGANNVKFRKIVHPGDQLVLEAEVMRNKSRIAQIQARAKVEGQVVAEAEMTFSFTDASFLAP